MGRALRTVASTSDSHSSLREDVRLLGETLGEVLRRQAGEAVFSQVEEIRRLSKESRGGNDESFQKLCGLLDAIPLDQARLITRAFAQFLNLANIAEQHHRTRRRRELQQFDSNTKSPPQRHSLSETFSRLSDLAGEELHQAVCNLEIELVLTAHPTEIARRTVLQKQGRIANILATLDRPDLMRNEAANSLELLQQEVLSLWLTDEIRRMRPTPVDEAQGGLLVFEQTLWDAVPRFLRELDRSLARATGSGLPLEAVPIRFGSWMGGDRDGNPSVTAEVTHQVCRLSRWMAINLYYREVDLLRQELSIGVCSDELRAKVGPSAREPYRALLGPLREKLQQARNSPGSGSISTDDLLTPLSLCHRSLVATGCEALARGRLADVIRRVRCFGTVLAKIDLRQDATRHAEAMSAITRAIGLGSYLDWDEGAKQRFLLTELASARPLVPTRYPFDEPTRDVLDTFAMAAQERDSLGYFVISMAQKPSDILAVELFQKEAGVRRPLPVVPLFETSSALADSARTIESLFMIPWYREHLRKDLGNRQQVMLGYSDSAKDAGRMKADWELYQAQDRLSSLCERSGVHLTLFHGRGGSPGRGGVPTFAAILSQPPGSIKGAIRVTEQGEMIQSKFGIPAIAERTLELYVSATLEATLRPPAPARPEWKSLMDELAATACQTYQQIVKEDPDFVRYFRQATPEQELAALNIGSRPAKRQAAGGVESLRAIPWVFAWTQNRLALPAWLGSGEALIEAIRDGRLETLRQMYREWPFFKTALDLLEMVLAKADAGVAIRYDEQLVEPDLRRFGAMLRSRLAGTEAAVLRVTGNSRPLENDSVLRRSIDVRNPYVDPINLIQASALRRLRECGGPSGPHCDPLLLETLLLTFNGIAAGMRNTG